MIVLWYFCPEIPNFLKEKKCLLKVTAILPEDWMICKYYRAMHVTVTSLTPTMTDLKEQLSNHWFNEWCQEWCNYPEHSAPKLFERMTAILVTGVLLESVRARQSTLVFFLQLWSSALSRDVHLDTQYATLQGTQLYTLTTTKPLVEFNFIIFCLLLLVVVSINNDASPANTKSHVDSWHFCLLDVDKIQTSTSIIILSLSVHISVVDIIFFLG